VEDTDVLHIPVSADDEEITGLEIHVYANLDVLSPYKHLKSGSNGSHA
jgi:hypothetical protein